MGLRGDVTGHIGTVVLRVSDNICSSKSPTDAGVEGVPAIGRCCLQVELKDNNSSAYLPYVSSYILPHTVVVNTGFITA